MTDLGLQVRVAAPEDEAALLAVVEQAGVAAGLLRDPRADGRAYLHPDPACGQGPVFVATRDGLLVGGGRLEAGGISYFVAPSFQGQGLGAVIAGRILLAYARYPAGGNPPQLVVRRENTASVRVAERLGFCFKGLAGRSPATLRYVYPPTSWAGFVERAAQEPSARAATSTATPRGTQSCPATR